MCPDCDECDGTGRVVSVVYGALRYYRECDECEGSGKQAVKYEVKEESEIVKEVVKEGEEV